MWVVNKFELLIYIGLQTTALTTDTISGEIECLADQ